jgi:hypothetical protein
MQRLVVVLAAALVAVAIYAVTAPASQQAVSPKRVAALEKKVSKLQKDLKTVATAVNNCLFYGAAPVASFGDAATEGYFYGNAQGQYSLENALDFVPQSQQAQALWFVGTSPACAQVMNSGRVLTPRISASLRDGRLGPLPRLVSKP